MCNEASEIKYEVNIHKGQLTAMWYLPVLVCKVLIKTVTSFTAVTPHDLSIKI